MNNFLIPEKRFDYKSLIIENIPAEAGMKTIIEKWCIW